MFFWQDWVETEPARGKPVPLKSQKHKRDGGLNLNFKTALGKKRKNTRESKTKKDDVTYYVFSVLQWKAIFSYTCSTEVRQTSNRSHTSELKHRTALTWIRSGYLNQSWWAIIISMRYCTGCGEACCDSLRHCVSMIDLYFILALLVCVHWDKKKDSPQLMTKGCPPKVKISCRQLEELQRQTLTFTKSLIYLIRSFSLHWFLVTKVSLGFREVILKCTAQKVQTGRLVGKPFRGQFEERCNALNFSHHPSQRRGRLVL